MKKYFIQMQSYEKFEENRWDECIERYLGTHEPNYSILRNLSELGIVYRVIEEDGEDTCIVSHNTVDTEMAMKREAR